MPDFTIKGRNDADTFTFEERETTSRSLSLGSPEVTRTIREDGEEEKIPNEAGLIAKQKSEAFAPTGSTVRVDQQQVGPFGRFVETQQLVIDDTPIDYELIAYDNQMGVFETKYRRAGMAGNPDYQIFQSSQAPYEVGATIDPLNEEDYVFISGLREQVKVARNNVMEDPSDTNQEILNELTKELYTGENRENLLKYHFMNHSSARSLQDGRMVLDADPWMDARQLVRYNESMAGRTGDTPVTGPTQLINEDRSTLGGFFSKYNDMVNFTRHTELVNANRYADLDYPVTTEEKLKGIRPEHYHLVLSQDTNRGALEMNRQIREAQENNALIEGASFLESVGYGTLAFVASPLTVSGGGLLAQSAVKGTGYLGKAAYISVRGKPALETFMRTSKSKHLATLNNWVTGSATGSAAAYAPNLLGDPTATLRGYGQDVLLDTAFGFGIGGLAVGNKVVRGTPLGKALGLQDSQVVDSLNTAVDGYHERIARNKSSVQDRYKQESKKYYTPNQRHAFGLVNNVAESEGVAVKVQSILNKAEPTEGVPLATGADKDAAVEQIRSRVTQELQERVMMALNKANPFGAVREPITPPTPEELKLITPEVLYSMDFKERRVIAEWAGIDLKEIPTESEVALKAFKDSGEAALVREEMKPTTVTGKVAETITWLTKDIADHMRGSDNAGIAFVGSKVTELGRGLSGVYRGATGGLIKARKHDQAVSKVLPAYDEHLNAYAAEKGHGAFQRAYIREQAAGDNSVVKEFGREFTLYMDSLRRGRTEMKVSPAVKRFVEHYSAFTDFVHNELVGSGVAGFSAERKIQNYVQRIYDKTAVGQLVEEFGEEKVVASIAEGIKRVNVDNPKVPKGAQALEDYARGILKNLQDLPEEFDQYMPGMESTSKERIDMDLSVEIGNGKKLVDMLDLDVGANAEKYSHRMSGLIGFTQSTNGLIDGNIAWDEFKEATLRDSKNLAKDTQFLNDTYDMMMGRPTQGGLPEWARSLRDMAVVTQMGNLGLNELMEAGLTINKAVMSIARSPQVAGKAFNASRGGKETKELLDEMISLTGMSNDMAYMTRLGTHLDQANAPHTAYAKAVNTAAHYMTGGNMMPVAKRLLSKTTGFDMVRAAKHRIAMTSMALDIGKYFKGRGLTSEDRLRDLGLLDAKGNSPLKRVFEDTVEYDDNGLVKKLNLDKWNKEEQEVLGNVLYRAASQDVQRHIVGEVPPYLNNPLWNVVLQYLSFPIVATNKQLARNAQFADMESLTGLMMNLIVTGTTQYAMEKTGLRKEEDFEKNTYKYYSSVGILPEVTQFMSDVMEQDMPSAAKIPIMSVMSNYVDAGTAGAEYVLSHGEDEMSYNDIKPLIYLQNHATLRAMYNLYAEGVSEREAYDIGAAQERALAKQVTPEPQVEPKPEQSELTNVEKLAEGLK